MGGIALFLLGLVRLLRLWAPVAFLFYVGKIMMTDLIWDGVKVFVFGFGGVVVNMAILMLVLKALGVLAPALGKKSAPVPVPVPDKRKKTARVGA